MPQYQKKLSPLLLRSIFSLLLLSACASPRFSEHVNTAPPLLTQQNTSRGISLPIQVPGRYHFGMRSSAGIETLEPNDPNSGNISKFWTSLSDLGLSHDNNYTLEVQPLNAEQSQMRILLNGQTVFEQNVLTEMIWPTFLDFTEKYFYTSPVSQNAAQKTDALDEIMQTSPRPKTISIRYGNANQCESVFPNALNWESSETSKTKYTFSANQNQGVLAFDLLKVTPLSPETYELRVLKLRRHIKDLKTCPNLIFPSTAPSLKPQS